MNMYNFGKIKHHIYETAVDGIANNDITKKKLLGKFIKLIKESKILRNQFNIYNNIETRCDESEISALEYVKENISILKRYKISDIVKENDKVTFLMEGLEINDDYPHKELHENIHKLIVTNKTSRTINGLMESTNSIKKFILSNKTKQQIVKESSLIPNSILEKYLTDKFKEEYENHELTENELQVLSVMAVQNIGEQENMFNENNKKTITLINETIKQNSTDVDLKTKLLDVKERLLEGKYNKDTFVGDINKLFNLQTKLK